LKWPGFVEFDDVNGKVLTYSAQDRYFNFCNGYKCPSGTALIASHSVKQHLQGVRLEKLHTLVFHI
jgi:hypothetical protein